MGRVTRPLQSGVAHADHIIVRDVWFTADDLEEILWIDRLQIERMLIEDCQILPEERYEHWAVDLDYMDRRVLTLLGHLPDRADDPSDDASSLLLRYALALVGKRQCLPAFTGSRPSFDAVSFELQDWEDRVRPYLRSQWCPLKPVALPELATAIHVT